MNRVARVLALGALGITAALAVATLALSLGPVSSAAHGGRQFAATVGVSNTSAVPQPLPTHWYAWGYGPSHDSVFAGASTTPADTAFSTKVGVSAIPDQPSVAGDLLFVGSDGGAVAAIDRHTGRVVWKVHLANQVMSTPLVHAGTILVGVGDKIFATPAPSGYQRLRGTGWSGIVALSETTGNVLWSVRTTGEVMPTLAYWGGNVYAATGGGHLWSVQAMTGIVEWKLRLAGFDSMSSPAVYDGTLYVGSGGTVFAVDLQTRRVLWHTAMPTVSGLSDCSPAVGANEVYIDAVTSLTATGGKAAQATEVMFALSRTTGRIVWQRAVGSGIIAADQMQTGVPALYGGLLYFGSPVTQGVYALDAGNGKLIWQFTAHGQVRGAPALVGGDVVTLDSAGYVDALDATTGKLVASYRLSQGVSVNTKTMFPTGFGPASPTVVGQTVYAASMDGHVYAFPLTDLLNNTWASTPWPKPTA